MKGFLVSIDAMGCEPAIAEKIVARPADYLLAVKGNEFLVVAMSNQFMPIKCGEHGRKIYSV